MNFVTRFHTNSTKTGDITKSGHSLTSGRFRVSRRGAFRPGGRGDVEIRRELRRNF